LAGGLRIHQKVEKGGEGTPGAGHTLINLYKGDGGFFNLNLQMESLLFGRFGPQSNKTKVNLIKYFFIFSD